MAREAECFCGCGRILVGSDAKISERRGKIVSALRAGLEDYTLPLFEGDAPGVQEARANVETLIADGYVIEAVLADVVHGEASAAEIDRRGLKSWIKTASKITSNSVETLDREMKRQGIGPYEPD